MAPNTDLSDEVLRKLGRFDDAVDPGDGAGDDVDDDDIPPMFAEHFVESADVCSNCFGIIRVEREENPNVDEKREDRQTAERILEDASRITPAIASKIAELKPVSTKMSPYTRDKLNTTVEYAPARLASNSKGVFCGCGVESSWARIWHHDDVDRSKFKRLVQSVIRTTERKRIDFDAEKLAYTALRKFDDGNPVDVALGEALEHSNSVVAHSKPTHPNKS